MYTRCPDCHTTLVVRAAELAHAGGIVSCGDCRKVFNALVSLFDEVPLPGRAPPATDTGQTGMPPVLQPLLVLSEPEHQAGEAEPALAQAPEIEAGAVPVGAEALAREQLAREQLTTGADSANAVAADADSTQADSMQMAEESAAFGQLGRVNANRQLPMTAWAVFAVLLVGYLSYQGWQIWRYRQQVVEVQRLTAQAREPEAFRIVSRDVHSHPSIQNAQMVSLRMLNTAGHPQPYPVLEVHLLDTTQNIVAVRRFHADEYLPPGGDPQELVAAQADFALVLQLRIPIGGNGGMTFHIR